MACCTFDRFKISTLTPSTFRNQANGTFKLLMACCIFGNLEIRT